MIHHPISRRALLRAGAAGAALAALPARLVDVLAKTVGTASNTWTYGQWSGLVGSTFKVSLAGGGTMSLKLISTTNFMPAGSSTTSGPQCFAAVFSGSLSPSLGQATQTVYQSQLGTFQIFLVPGAATSTAQHYVAIVNTT
jgi:hypothetical protein